jgi:hypothetical protein
MTLSLTHLIRALLVAAAAALVLVGLPAPAGAGDTVLGIPLAECDAATDQYVVPFRIINGGATQADIHVTQYQVDGVDAAPLPTFAPDPLPGNGSSEAVVNIPGTSESIYLEVDLDYGVAVVTLDVSQEFVGDCFHETTTTASDGTPSTSVAPAAEAVELQPAFTG